MRLHGIELTDAKLVLISIDPGTNMCGFTVIEYGLKANTKKLLFCDTIRGNPLANAMYDASTRSVIGDRLSRNMAYGRFLNSLMVKYDSEIIVSEAPYMGRFINAYKALTEQITIFRATATNFHSHMEFSLLEPSVVKKYMGVKGTSGDKDLMHTALRKRKDIDFNGIDIGLLDEHSVDSTCVGLAACTIIHNNFKTLTNIGKKH